MRLHARSRRRPAAALIGSAALLALTPSAHAAGVRALLPGTLPTFAGSAPDLGAAAPAAPVHAIISLKDRGLPGLRSFIARVSDPASADYEHYLTPAQFRARYSPSAAAVARVEAFARGAGLHVASVPSNHAYVQVDGTVAAAQKAFGVTIARFTVSRRTVQAPTRAVTIPSALRSVVTDVVGLNTGDLRRPEATPPIAFVNAGPCSTSFGQQATTGTPAVYGAVQPDVPCGYTPQQLQGAYGLSSAIASGLDGRGQKVAIIDAYSSPTAQADLDQWSANRGMTSTPIEFHDTAQERDTPEGPAPTVPVDIPGVGSQVPPLVDPQGWAGEETLDLEAVHAMAPGATIVYQGAVSPYGDSFDMAQNDAVNGKIAQIISNSYGSGADTEDDTEDATWMQAAATGIGIFFSSGDDGDQTDGATTASGMPDTTDKSVDAPANSPYVTSVGGTTLGVGAKDDYQFETYWGTYSSTFANGAFTPAPPGAYNSGGGGGTSQVYPEPAYQKGVVPDAYASIWKDDPNHQTDPVSGDTTSVLPGRVVPDVAMLADPNSGFLIGGQEDFSAYQHNDVTAPGDTTRYGEYRIGGTSLSSPLFAGVMALADQAAGTPHGFANPALYAGKAGIAFHDVSAPASPVAVVRTNYVDNTNGDDGTQTLLRTAGQLGSLHSVPGYDDSTGLGSPDGLGFLRTLAPNSTLIPDAAATTAPAGGGSATAPAPGTTPPAATTAKACRPPSQLVYLLHAEKGQRVTRLQVIVSGRTVVRRTGHRLTRVTVKRPKGTTFTVVVFTHSNRGSTKRSTRTYTASGCKKGAAKVVSHRVK